MPVATPAAPPRQAQSRQPQRAAVPAVPFTRASRRKTMLAFSTNPTQLGAQSINLGPIQIPPGGFLQYIELDVTITAAANAANVAFAADGPFSVIGTLSVENASGDSLIVPISGYQLYLANKWLVPGIDAPYADPKNDPNFAATAGVGGGAGGSASFRLRIPFELDPRDAFCSLPNMAANKSYKIQLQLAPVGQVYATAPTVAPSVSVQGVAHYWSQPNPTNGAGIPQETNPRSAGSVSMIRVQHIPLTAGDKLLTLASVGNLIRGIIMVLRTAAGARTEAAQPDVHQLILNNDTIFYLPNRKWRSDQARAYGYTGATDARVGLDSGVNVWHQFLDTDGHVRCDGDRSQWLATLDATLLQYRATAFGADASTLEVITNEIKPTSAAAVYAPRLG